MNADKPLSEFASDDAAYDYSRENKACVYDADMACAFCSRWDH